MLIKLIMIIRIIKIYELVNKTLEELNYDKTILFSNKELLDKYITIIFKFSTIHFIYLLVFTL